MTASVFGPIAWWRDTRFSLWWPEFDSRWGHVTEHVTDDEVDAVGEQLVAFLKGWNGAYLNLFLGVMATHVFHCEGWKYPEEGEWDTDKCEGCCPVCCDPCNALAWHRDNADESLTFMLKARYPACDAFVWQREDGGVDWSKVEWHWHNLDPTYCHGSEECA